jgi:hypothetical protein
MTSIERLTYEQAMKKETKNRSVFHLFPRRSLSLENNHQRQSDDIIDQKADRIASSEKTIPNNTMNNDSPQTSTLAKICICFPESTQNAQTKNQQIDVDLLYAYDPFQLEVGQIIINFYIEYLHNQLNHRTQ